MIQFQSVSLHRGSKQLLSDANLSIHACERVGLVGSNGSGKSSLFQLLLGRLDVDQGHWQIPVEWRIGHMRQEIEDSDRSALDFVMDGDQALRRVQEELAGHSGDDVKLAELYGKLEDLDGYTAEPRAASLLHGLGFAPGDEKRPVADFSGGWRVRLALAQALMTPSDLLLLDEPTNHLDLSATLWLEQWLKSYPGTLVIVSHDRDFLDNVINRVVHIDHTRLETYSGNYSDFERQRAERLAQQQQLFLNQQARIKEITRFVDRFRAKATKARQAQSRLKQLQRMEVIAPAHVDSPFSFSIPCADKVPQNLVTLTDAVVGYDSEHRVEGINLSLHDSSRIGLLGANGAGKSTLLKSLAGELPLLAGERICGDGLKIGYFAQHQLQNLDPDASAALHVQRLSPTASEQAVRNFLGGFDFQGDRAFEPVRHFSGGEKARLTLALIAWTRPNLLILDEPTNHLDLEMRHALTVALQGYEGAVVLVSHDRHLIRNTADELLLVANQRVEAFSGDLEEYESWLAQQSGGAAEAPKSAPVGSRKEQRQRAADARAALKPLTDRLKKLERQLDKLHQEEGRVGEALLDGTLYEDGNKARLQELLQEQIRIKQTLSQTEEEWLETQEALEQLQV
ncbi:ATP-binding cassette domain-containing protein [Gilvimarinus sp. F26214L]|uniref:ATP-binding cassette domain-containing protein n=1 Tax=Gilvimarinus sp. DZF01 TaxID=3461371 RepID=UPI004045CA5E